MGRIRYSTICQMIAVYAWWCFIVFDFETLTAGLFFVADHAENNFAVGWAVRDGQLELAASR